MNIHEARHLIDDRDAPIIARIEAASLLSQSDDATPADLVACLRCRGVIAELAALGLYRRTGRPEPRRLLDFANPDQWEQYLIRKRLQTDHAA